MRHLPALLLLVLSTLVAAACEPAANCSGEGFDPGVGVGFAGMEGWEPIQTNDLVLVEPGSQGYGLMVLINVRYQGIAISDGAHSQADVQIVLDTGETITEDGSMRLASLCQDDGALVSRNRRIELLGNYASLEDLEGLDTGINAHIVIDSVMPGGETFEQDLPVILVGG